MRRLSVETTWHGHLAHESQGHLGPAGRSRLTGRVTSRADRWLACKPCWYECNFSCTACEQAVAPENPRARRVHASRRRALTVSSGRKMRKVESHNGLTHYPAVTCGKTHLAGIGSSWQGPAAAATGGHGRLHAGTGAHRRAQLGSFSALIRSAVLGQPAGGALPNARVSRTMLVPIPAGLGVSTLRGLDGRGIATAGEKAASTQPVNRGI